MTMVEYENMICSDPKKYETMLQKGQTAYQKSLLIKELKSKHIDKQFIENHPELAHSGQLKRL